MLYPSELPVKPWGNDALLPLFSSSPILLNPPCGSGEEQQDQVQESETHIEVSDATMDISLEGQQVGAPNISAGTLLCLMGSAGLIYPTSPHFSVDSGGVGQGR